MKEEKEKTIQDVISRRKQHTRRVDSKLIMKAYNYAYSHHGDQCRKSGEPYIIHPLNVAYILADIGLDDSTICAALLHDVVEDTEVTQEDITREFVQFCNQQVITLDDVINDNYTQRDIQALNTAERYATTMGLSQVDDNNLEKVRGFVTGLGAEFGAIFDALWTHGDESKLERLAEAKLAEMSEGGIRRQWEIRKKYYYHI